MRKSFYIYSVVGALLALLCMVNCTDRELFQGQHADGVAGFSLQEAKEYFEEQAGTEPVMSRSAGRAALDPGDFAPYWESAVASSQCRLGSYDVPIAPAYRFKAVVADGNGRAGKVEVGQKLVVVKNLDTGRMSQYILSLIPTRSLAPRSGRQLCDAFVNCGDKGGFSGLAVYTCVYSSVVACVSRYEDGRRMEGVFLLDAPDASELHRRIDYARHLLSSVAVRAHRAVTTRFEWDIDGGELPEVEITPDDNDDNYTWPDEDWLHPGYDDYETPEPEDNNSDGNEDEGYTGGNNSGEQNPNEEIVPLSEAEQQKVNELLATLRTKLGINTSNYQFAKPVHCGGFARTGKNGELFLCDTFFTNPRLTDTDRLAILYHEMYHIDHKHFGEYHSTELNSPIRLDPPAHIEEYLREKLEDDFKDINIDPQLLEFTYNWSITVTLYISIEYYENELETYREERNQFRDVSEYYENERTYFEWLYQQILDIINNKK